MYYNLNRLRILTTWKNLWRECIPPTKYKELKESSSPQEEKPLNMTIDHAPNDHTTKYDNVKYMIMPLNTYDKRCLHSNSWKVNELCLCVKAKNHLKGQSSEPIFWVECKNLFVIGPILGTPNIFDFGLIFAEIFVFKNRLPGIVYYAESKLPKLFIRGGSQK